MSSIQELRTELASFAPDGWNGYDHIPSSVQFPAVVVGLPEEITLDGSMTYSQIRLPLIIVVGSAMTADQEGVLTAGAIEVATGFAGVSGSHFASCLVESIDQFFDVDVGGKSAFSCRVNLSIVANIS